MQETAAASSVEGQRPKVPLTTREATPENDPTLTLQEVRELQGEVSQQKVAQKHLRKEEKAKDFGGSVQCLHQRFNLEFDSDQCLAIKNTFA